MIEDKILSGLIFNEDYLRQVIPFLKSEYFDDFNDRNVFDLIKSYTNQYNKAPSKEALLILLDGNDSINEEQHSAIKEVVNNTASDDETDTEFLVDQTEEFCKSRALYNAIRESILIIDEEHKELDKGAIPNLLSDALGVSFDGSIGHSWASDLEARYEYYHRKEEKVEFDIESFNKITGGGFSKKTLNVLMASTGVGKSLVMCHFAAANYMHGKKVLYITMELSEEEVARRIDANLIDIDIPKIKDLSHGKFVEKVNRVKSMSTGDIIIKQYPTGAAGSAHFRHLLNELRVKSKFVPDIIYIDYINICMSARMRNNRQSSYEYIKAIAEEFRGLAVEFNVPIVSATQVNRAGHDNSDAGLENTSESWGLPATVDWMALLISNDELAALNQFVVKQLKSRYGDINYMKKFVLGVDKMRMKVYDVEESAQTLLDVPKDKDTLMIDQRSKKPNFAGFN